MFNGKIKDELINLKNQLEQNYVTIYTNGNSFTDTAQFVLNSEITKLNDCCSGIDFYLQDTVKKFCEEETVYDTIQIDFSCGLIFPETSLGENNKIIPTSSPLKNRVRLVPGNIYAFNNGELVSAPGSIFGKKMFVDFDSIVHQLKKAGFEVSGITSYEDLENAVYNQTGEKLTIELDFNKELEEDIAEEVVVEKPKSKIKSFLGL